MGSPSTERVFFTHDEAATIAIRNKIPAGLRKWGMVVTVFNDGGSSGNYTLVYGASSTNKGDNSNWQLLGSTPGAPGGAVNELQKNDGASGFTGTKIFSAANGDMTLGDGLLAGINRTFQAAGVGSDVGISFVTKGIAPVTLTSGTGAIQANNGGNAIINSFENKVTLNTSDTNTVKNVLRLQHSTTATPAVGIGTAIDFLTEVLAGLSVSGSAIQSVSTDLTAGSEDFDLVFKNLGNGGTPATNPTEKFRISSKGNFTFIDCTSIPGSSPVGGFYLYSNSGIPTFRTSTGKVLSIDEAVGRSGTAIAFDKDAIYGLSAAETGNITVNTTGAIVGMSQLLIHNNGTAPTFAATCKIISGAYVVSVANYIMFLYVSSTVQLVTISQEL